MSDAPVVVGGGGIAGLSAALAIARAGRPVTLFEREASSSEEGAGIQLSPNATRRLRGWGLLDAVSCHALTPESVVVRRARDAAILAEMDLSDAYAWWGAPFRIAHRADLLATLLTAAAREPGVVIRTGLSVTRWYDDATGVRVTTSDGETHAGAALVIADGVRSSLHAAFLAHGMPHRTPRTGTALGGEGSANALAPTPTLPIAKGGGTAPIHSGRVAWRALVPADRVAAFARRPSSNLWLGPDAHVVHYPLRGGAVVNIVAIVAGRADAGDADLWSRAGTASDLRRRLAAWHPRLRDLVGAADAWRVWPLLARPAPDRLASGRVAMIGDAAHPMMPFLAQGGAQAIEDAAALGDAFASRADVDGALVAFSEARQSRVRRVVKASERQATIYHLRGPAAFARDVAMQMFGARGMRAATDWIYRA